MSESKLKKTQLLAEGERQNHRPPEGMMNVSGQTVVSLTRGVMDLLEEPFDKGMQADVAAHVLMTAAVDLWRANYGDNQCRDLLVRGIERRLEKSTEYWQGRAKS